MSLARIGLISVLTVTMSMGSGCSFLFVHGPPEDHAQMARFECSESHALPVLDLIWAGLNGLGAATVDDTNPQHDQVVGVGIAWLVVSGISAIYGFNKVGACNKAKRERDERYLPPDIAMPASSPGAVPPP